MSDKNKSIPLKEAWWISGQRGTMTKGMTFSMPMDGYISPCNEHYFSDGELWRKVDKKELAYDEPSATKMYNEQVQYWIELHEKWSKDNSDSANELKAKLKK